MLVGIQIRRRLSTNTNAGLWKAIKLEKTEAAVLASSRALPSTRRAISAKRQAMAQACGPFERIALEAADDDEGFSFWLAMTTQLGGAFTYRGASKTVDGVRFRDGGQYITVRLLERFPPDCPTTFKLEADEWTIDAEAVIARNVILQGQGMRLRTRGKSVTETSNQVGALFVLGQDEQRRLELASEESFQALEIAPSERKQKESDDESDIENCGEELKTAEKKTKKRKRKKGTF
jgi:hypothetical protein